MKKVIALILSLLMCVSMLSACSGGEPAVDTTGPISGGGDEVSASADADGNGRIDTITIALPAAPGDLAPFDAKSNFKKVIYCTIYDTLFDFIDGEYVPNVAIGYTEIDDLHWEVKIHENVTDWNGNNMTAHDIVKCYERFIEAGYVKKFDNYAGVEATDDYTLLFTWKAPNTSVAGLEYVFTNVQLYCDSEYSKPDASFATNPVGTGPYKVKSFTGGSGVVVEVNEDYWNDNPTAIRQQNADVIEYDFVTEASLNVIGLQTGDIDISFNIPAENFSTFESDSNYFTVRQPTNENYGLGFNCGENSVCQDQNLRLAILYATDFSGISQALSGTAACTGFASPSTPDYVAAWDEQDTFYNVYDVNLAKQYLEKSSYKGEKLTLATGNSEIYKTMAQLIQVCCEQIGVNVELNSMDEATLSANLSNATAWDMIILRCGGTFVVNAMNKLYNNGEYKGEHCYGFISDDKLQNLFSVASNAATWNEESLDAVFQYVVEKGYHASIIYQTLFATGSSDVSEFYFWDGVVLPNCCTYNLE